MMLKASLHTHTMEDKTEGYIIRYDVYQLIDWSAFLGFKVLGLTCHKKLVYREDYVSYAASRGILLLLGVELNMRKKMIRNDLVILNVNPEEAKAVEKINTFRKLSDYKKNHPEIFVLAPHPLSDRRFSMGKKKFIKNIDLFDGVEHCWYYSRRLINPNKKTQKITRQYSKPFVATSDAHFLKYFNTDYILVEADKLEAASFFEAIRRGAFTNVTKPKKFYQLAWCALHFQFKKIIFLPRKLRSKLLWTD